MTLVLLETLHPDAHVLLAAHDQVEVVETPADLGSRLPYADIVAILTRAGGRSADRALPYGQVDLPTLLQQADIVSIHCALAAETHHLLDAQALALMKPSVLLINTARGAIIDAVALRVAIQEGQIAGFGADVLEQEPPDHADPLLQHERVLITPHTSALTEETYRAMCMQTVENVLAVLRVRGTDQ